MFNWVNNNGIGHGVFVFQVGDGGCVARNGRTREEINEEELISFIGVQFNIVDNMVVAVTIMFKCVAMGRGEQ